MCINLHTLAIIGYIHQIATDIADKIESENFLDCFIILTQSS